MSRVAGRFQLDVFSNIPPESLKSPPTTKKNKSYSLAAKVEARPPAVLLDSSPPVGAVGALRTLERFRVGMADHVDVSVLYTSIHLTYLSLMI